MDGAPKDRARDEMLATSLQRCKDPVCNIVLGSGYEIRCKWGWMVSPYEFTYFRDDSHPGGLIGWMYAQSVAMLERWTYQEWKISCHGG